MENGARPAAGAHWIPAAQRARVIQKILENMSQQLPLGHQVDKRRFHEIASAFEDKVFRESDNAQDYLRAISKKMVGLQHNRQPAAQAASGLGQQQAQNQMRPVNSSLAMMPQTTSAVPLPVRPPQLQPAASDLVQQKAQMGQHQMRPVHSSAAMMPQTASAVPLPVRPPQLQNMHVRVNPAQPAKLPPAAPLVQLHPTVVTQTQNMCPTQQPQRALMRMNQQGLMMEQRQSYQTQNGHHADAAMMQTIDCGGQNNEQFRNTHAAGEVDWREDLFQKITSLKDAHFSELMEFGRTLQAHILQIKAKGQLESLPKELAAQYRNAQHTMERIKRVLSFLGTQKTNVPEAAKDQLDMLQNVIRDLLSSYSVIKARKAARNARLQSQICRETPQVVNVSGATEDSQQNRHEQHEAEPALSHSSLTQQENHSNNLAGEAEDNTVRVEAESHVSINLPGDTAAFTGTTCSQQRHPADDAVPQLMTRSVEPAGTSPAQQQTHSTHSVHVEAEDMLQVEAESPVAFNLPGDAIPQLTQSVEPAGTSPARQQTHSSNSVHVEVEDDSVQTEAETPVSMEALVKRGVDAARSLSPTVLHSLASDMGVNLKRAFSHTTSYTMNDSSCYKRTFDDEPTEKSCYKRQKMHDGTLPDEIRAAYSMLVDTKIRISEDDDTGGADGTVIEFSYNAVSLTQKLKEAVCASEVTTKLLVPADYPLSSPVILGGAGEGKGGVPWVVDMAFRRAIVLLPEPRSIEEMAKAWDSIVRRSVERFVNRLCGGPFTRRYGGWECIPV